MDFSDLIAHKIKELMKQHNVSTYKMESLTGIYDSTLSMFLNRQTKTIRLENLLYICEALNITLSEFFADPRFLEAEAKDWKKKKSK